MNHFIQTIKNIWRIEDLRFRILMTLGLVAIYRVGSYIVLPGIDGSQLHQLEDQGGKGIFGLVNIFAGGAFTRASIFALGIMPYISASIVMQLLGMAVPAVQKLQKDESGRRTVNQYTRILTVVVTALQASAYVVYIKSLGAQILVSPGLFWFSTLVVLTAGTIFVMWLGEKITDKGIGNGISLLIMVGILARLPFALAAEFSSRMSAGGNGGLVAFIGEIAALIGVIILVILLVQGTRKIPVQYAKRIVGNKQYGGVRQYIPLKVNAAGVMPIIFAQALMFIPATISQFFPDSAASQGAGVFTDHTSFWYNVIFSLLIVVFTYFYTALIVNPVQMADDMKRNGGFIPGIKPGKKTADFIDGIMSRITLPGSFFLALVAILPAFAAMFGMISDFGNFYGGTSLLIMVGVILDTLQQIESHLLMRHYDGLMKSGRIKGRTSAASAY
ncbi:protein translocase subunit SecY [Bacteroidota bacterium]|nr:protein translocase subunit SecY [Bacteroidota bacterium]